MRMKTLSLLVILIMGRQICSEILGRRFRIDIELPWKRAK